MYKGEWRWKVWGRRRKGAEAKRWEAWGWENPLRAAEPSLLWRTPGKPISPLLFLTGSAHRVPCSFLLQIHMWIQHCWEPAPSNWKCLTWTVVQGQDNFNWVAEETVLGWLCKVILELHCYSPTLLTLPSTLGTWSVLIFVYTYTK